MVLVSVHDQLALLLWACCDTQQWECMVEQNCSSHGQEAKEETETGVAHSLQEHVPNDKDLTLDSTSTIMSWGPRLYLTHGPLGTLTQTVKAPPRGDPEDSNERKTSP
jgi:hypothetical protein